MMPSTQFADQDAHGPLPGPPTDWPRRRREHLYSRPIGVKQNDPKNAFHTRQTRWKMVEFFLPNNTLLSVSRGRLLRKPGCCPFQAAQERRCICSKVLTGATLLKLTGWNRSRTLLVYVLHASFALPAAHTPSRKVFEVPASLCGAWHDQSLRDCVWDGLNTWYGSPYHYCAFILPRFHATVVRAHSSTPDST